MDVTRDQAMRDLQASIDLELLDLWSAITESPELNAALDDDDVRRPFAMALRVAWGQGYNTAMAEHRRGEAGAFAEAHPLPTE